MLRLKMTLYFVQYPKYQYDATRLMILEGGGLPLLVLHGFLNTYQNNVIILATITNLQISIK
jgi:hypothetical protein